MDSDIAKKNTPYISVILPVFNGGRYLQNAIKSILNQSFSDFEFIIINDGSTDRSSQILKKFADDDRRIVLIERNNKGLVYTLNEGISLAKGKYIARMDSDDISYLTRFQQQIEILEREDADICGCHYIVISANDKKLIPILCPLSDDFIILSLSASTVPFAHGSAMMRRSFMLKNDLKYKTDSLAEDYNLWVECYAKKAKFVNVDDFLFSYRIHTNSITDKITKQLKNAGKSVSLIFLKNNINVCRNAINVLLCKELSELEEVSLLLVSYRLFKLSGDKLIWKVIRKVSLKSKGVGFLKILFRNA